MSCIYENENVQSNGIYINIEKNVNAKYVENRCNDITMLMRNEIQENDYILKTISNFRMYHGNLSF